MGSAITHFDSRQIIFQSSVVLNLTILKLKVLELLDGIVCCYKCTLKEQLALVWNCQGELTTHATSCLSLFAKVSFTEDVN
jgi:hypothetical protein